MNRKSPLLSLPFVLFAVGSAMLLLLAYPDMLYTAQDRNEFFQNGLFLDQKCAEPFGLMSYVGCYLTQFFYHPFVGVALLVGFWGIIYVALLHATNDGSDGMSWGKYVFALIPLAALLSSITQVGYWVYAIPIRGYWFAMTLAYLIILCMLLGARLTPVRWRWMWFLAGAMAFRLVGSNIILFGLCLLAMQVGDKDVKGDDRLRWVKNGAGLLLVLVAPLLWARLGYNELSVSQVLKAGLPIFESDTMTATRHSWVFVILAVSTLLAFCRQFVNMKRTWLLGVASVAVMGAMVATHTYKDYNFQAEMRMNNAALNSDWQTVLKEAEKAQQPTRTMVMLKDIALMNTGELGTRSFDLQSTYVGINNPDSLNLEVMQIAAPVIYYNFGKVQFATRWCMENSVRLGFSPYYMKVFVLAARQTGETANEARYMKLLSQTQYHKNWRPQPLSDKIKELESTFIDVIDTDANNCVQYITENFAYASGSTSSLVKELNLYYSMLYRNTKCFWQAFVAYAAQTQGKGLPRYYQEAYLMFARQGNVQLPFEVEIAPYVLEDYQRFNQAAGQLAQQGLNMKQIAEQLKPSWDHTYWWYLVAHEES